MSPEGQTFEVRERPPHPLSILSRVYLSSGYLREKSQFADSIGAVHSYIAEYEPAVQLAGQEDMDWLVAHPNHEAAVAVRSALAHPEDRLLFFGAIKNGMVPALAWDDATKQFRVVSSKDLHLRWNNTGKVVIRGVQDTDPFIDQKL